MKMRSFFAAGLLGGLALWSVGQNPGLKPKPGDLLPPKPGPRLPGRPQLEPKLPLPDRTKPMIDPLKGRTISLRERLETTSILTPGDEVVFEPPSNFDPGQVRILFENRESKELFEVPVGTFQRVTLQPSKYSHGNVRLPATYSRYGFIAPQVPRGAYDVFYRQAALDGPRKAVEIRPKLVASGRRIGAVDGRAFVVVRPVGPSVAPRKLKGIVRLTPPGGREIESLANLNLEPEPVRPTIQLADFSGPLTYPGIDHIRADESSQARFEFGLRQVGTGRATFSSPGFESTTHTLEVHARNIPPEVEEPGRNLRMVCLGDSLAWGQGLKESNKFSFKTADRMRQLTGRAVSRTVFAHSGGTVMSKNQADENRRLPGEVPIWFPSIPRQAELAASAVNGTVDLVLLDGATNDLDVAKIINPFLDSRSEIRSMARSLKPAIRDMLVDIGQTFAYRKALIVYTGVYPIVTSKSEINLMAAGLATFISLAPLPGGPAVSGVLAATIAAVLVARKDAVVEQSRIYYEEATAAIQGAIAEAKNRLGTNAEDRILFADPGFSNADAYASLDTRLWTFGIEDEVAGQRAIDGAPFAAEAPVYLVASMGHPNVQGAQKYASRISTLISTAAARTIWDATQPRKRMNVAMNRSITVPAGATGVELEFRITARDASTGVDLPGNVFINGEYAGRTSELLKRTFRRPSNANPKPAILVVRPGYADGVLQYDIR